MCCVNEIHATIKKRFVGRTVTSYEVRGVSQPDKVVARSLCLGLLAGNIYLKKMRIRDLLLDVGWGTVCTLAEMKVFDGNFYSTQAAKGD